MKNQEIVLKYGCNPHQKPAKIYAENKTLPFKILMVILVTLILWTPLIHGN